jgi:hypothetical protein
MGIIVVVFFIREFLLPARHFLKDFLVIICLCIAKYTDESLLSNNFDLAVA